MKEMKKGLEEVKAFAFSYDLNLLLSLIVPAKTDEKKVERLYIYIYVYA